MKILIMSDGTPTGTRVTDEFHKPIEGVCAVSWSQKVGELPVVEITMRTAMVAVSGEIDTLPEVPPAPAPNPAPAKEKPKNEKRIAPK